MFYRLPDYIILRIKGERLNIDKNIPKSYLFSIIIRYSVSLIRGLIKFYKLKIFIGSNVEIRCKKNYLLHPHLESQITYILMHYPKRV